MPAPRVQAAGQALGEAEHDVHDRGRVEPRRELARGPAAALNGRLTPCAANSKTLGRSSVPTSMSRNGVGTCWLTTRIISSGVTPLAASEATNEPAEVPT